MVRFALPQPAPYHRSCGGGQEAAERVIGRAGGGAEPPRPARLRAARALRSRPRAARQRGEIAPPGPRQPARSLRRIPRRRTLARELPHPALRCRRPVQHDPLRPKKLLLHRHELDRLAGQVRQKGLTLVPLRIYFRNGLAKCELALARGRRTVDRRAAEREREARREAAEALYRWRRR